MRVSIITGGGSGIGAAVARRLAGPDQSLMLHGQGADAAGLARLNAVAEQCRAKGAKVEIQTGDLAAAGAGAALVEAPDEETAGREAQVLADVVQRELRLHD